MEAGLASGLLGAPVHSDCRHHGLWQQRRRDDKHDGRTFYWIDSFVLYSGVEQTESTLAHAIVCSHEQETEAALWAGSAAAAAARCIRC